MPARVDAAVATAREKVADAEAAMKDAAAEAAPRRQSAAEQAGGAIQRAQAEVGLSLPIHSGVRRRSKSARLPARGEAAGTCRRRPAASRKVGCRRGPENRPDRRASRGARAAAQRRPGRPEISAGVKSNAPAASQLLDALQPPIADTAQQLAAAEEQPGAANKPLAKAAGQTAQHLAGELTKVAAEVRREQGQAAEELTKIAGEQLAKAERRGRRSLLSRQPQTTTRAKQPSFSNRRASSSARRSPHKGRPRAGPTKPLPPTWPNGLPQRSVSSKRLNRLPRTLRAAVQKARSTPLPSNKMLPIRPIDSPSSPPRKSPGPFSRRPNSPAKPRGRRWAGIPPRRTRPVLLPGSHSRRPKPLPLSRCNKQQASRPAHPI